MQEPEGFREEETYKETRETQPESREMDNFVEMLECFQKNSAGSVCPNTAKGKFVSFQEAHNMFRPL